MRLSDAQLTAVLERYGYDVCRFLGSASGYRNNSHFVMVRGGDRYNFIVYKNEHGIVSRIERLNALSLHVSRRGLPMRVPVDKRIMVLASDHATRYGGLYTYLDGETIPWEAYTRKHIKLLGMVLGRLHRATETYRGILPAVTDEYGAIVARMQTYFAADTVRRALYDKLAIRVDGSCFEAFRVILQCAHTLPDQIPLHMDVVRSNVLFRPAQPYDTLIVDTLACSGLLDMEKAARGHALFDVARTVAFLLVDSHKPPEKIYTYFLNSGYRKRGGRQLMPVRIAGGDLLQQLISLFLTYDLYKFLKQNPYESLSENHHFIRTVDILRHRHVIQ